MQGSNAIEFAQGWASAWNARDVEAVLAHFDEDVSFVSPVARKIGFALDGIVQGKTALRRYWQAALAGNPTLHFRVRDVFQGIDTIAILYSNQHGTDRIEFLRFRNKLVIEGHGTFAVPDRPDDRVSASRLP